MSWLIDTNVVARMAQPAHVLSKVSRDSLNLLSIRKESLVIVPQVLYEFWVVATRPASQNGLGLSIADAHLELTKLKVLFPVLADTPAILPAWENLAVLYAAAGKQGHDARLVAAMQTNGISHLLTFNSGDFQRFPGITVMTPHDVATPTP